MKRDRYTRRMNSQNPTDCMCTVQFSSWFKHGPSINQRVYPSGNLLTFQNDCDGIGPEPFAARTQSLIFSCRARKGLMTEVCKRGTTFAAEKFTVVKLRGGRAQGMFLQLKALIGLISNQINCSGLMKEGQILIGGAERWGLPFIPLGISTVMVPCSNFPGK